MSNGVALVYVRVSKYDATDRGHKVSPETQLDRCKALPALHGLPIEAFEDLDYSGKDFKRPAFLRLQERLQRGDVSVIACYSLSRLSRSVVKTYGFLEDLQSQGVAFVSATEPIDTSTPMGKAFMGNTAVWSQLERELTSERVRHALAYKKGQGHWVGTLPAGFKRDSAGGIAVDRPVAKTIRLVFEQYATGAYSFRTLAAWLNRRGIKTIATRGGNGRPPAPLWSGDVLKEVLARPAYGGMLQTTDGRIPANLPEMVPIRLWGRCEDIRKR
jgi:site-specific DNA recombinase